ncbi:MAG: methyl-accepting chemotaxis protein [Chlamydiota bacterium]
MILKGKQVLLWVIIALALGGGSLAYLNYSYNRQSPLEDVYQSEIASLDHLRSISELYSWDIIAVVHRALEGSLSPQEASSNISHALNRISYHWDAYQQVVGEAPQQTQLWDKLERSMNEIGKTLNDVTQNLDKNSLKEVRTSFNEAYSEITAFETSLARAIDQQFRVIRNTLQIAEDSYQNHNMVELAIIGVMSLVVLLIIFVFIAVGRRRIKDFNSKLNILSNDKQALEERLKVSPGHPLEGTVETINGLLAKLQDHTQNLELELNSAWQPLSQVYNNYKKLDGNFEEVDATANEFSFNIKQLLTNINKQQEKLTKIREVFEPLYNEAPKSQMTLDRIKDDITGLEDMAVTLSAKQATMVDKLEDISGHIKTIDKCAEHTNVLSFNASIEAEKAGEFGQGFSVIAYEIRTIAEQFKAVNKEIEQKVSDIKATLTTSIEDASKYKASLEERVKAVSKIGQHYAQSSSCFKDLHSRLQEVYGLIQKQSELANKNQTNLDNLSSNYSAIKDIFQNNNQKIENIRRSKATSISSVTKE